MNNLPDIYVEKTDGRHTVVANKKARRVLNKGFDGNPPPWRKMADGSVLASPQYRAIEIEEVACVAAMLCSVHDASLCAMFWCETCQAAHVIDDATAKDMWVVAKAGSAAALPLHKTVQ